MAQMSCYFRIVYSTLGPAYNEFGYNEHPAQGAIHNLRRMGRQPSSGGGGGAGVESVYIKFCQIVPKNQRTFWAVGGMGPPISGNGSHKQISMPQYDWHQC